MFPGFPAPPLLRILAGDLVRRRRAPDLIFVLGAQRSGTNVLRQSLSLDPDVVGFNERSVSRLYENWHLRPEPQIRRYLRRQRSTVLLKPIRSVIDRPVADFLAEFRAYDLKVAWIYRDPVAVFHSRAQRWPAERGRLDEFIAGWNAINNSALDAADPRVAVVSFDRLSKDASEFKALCRFLGVRGEYLFRAREPLRAADISPEVAERIARGTEATLARLDSSALRPGPADSLRRPEPPSFSSGVLATPELHRGG